MSVAGGASRKPQRRERTLPDGFVQKLVAAGQADVVVGMVTQDHAATIGPVVTAVLSAFSGALLRERTVLLDVDGDSRDLTQAIVQGTAATDDSQRVAWRHPLRTVHRISTPFHGLPGRARALRMLLAATELLGAKVLVVVDPENAALQPSEVAALAGAVLRQGADFAKCAPARSPWSGLLVSQLVRPLIGALCGRAVREPLETQFACSRGFIQAARAQLEGPDEGAEDAADLRLAVFALAGAFSVVEVGVDREALVPLRAPALPAVFGDVVSGLLRALPAQPRTGAPAVAHLGTAVARPEERPAIDVEASADAFREGFTQLRPLLRQLLPDPCFGALDRAHSATPPEVDDAVWVQTVAEFLRLHHTRRLGPGQLALALLPIYRGRVATFLEKTANASSAEVEARLEALERAFSHALSAGTPAGGAELERGHG